MNETELLLDVLRDEEQSTLAALKEVQEKKKQVLLAQQEEAELAELLKRQEHLALLKASPTELKVLGVSYKQLNLTAAQHSTLRVLQVHKDIEKLLAAALPSRSDEHFYQLVSALAVHLVGNYTNNKQLVSTLRADAATMHYFTVSPDTSVSIAIAAKVSVSVDTLNDLVTAWALSWGQATQFEDATEVQ